MTHALVTILAPIETSLLARLTAQVGELGNPANDSMRSRLDQLDGESGTHFASLHAIPAGSGHNGYLVFEFSADGTEEEALTRIVYQIGTELEGLFQQAWDWRESSSLLEYLKSHRIQVGHGLFSRSPGVTFSGTPGMSVGRIRKECDLAREIAGLLAGQHGDMRAIDRLAAVRAAIREQGNFAWALEQPPPPLPQRVTPPAARLILQLLSSFARTFLWPIGLVVLGWSILVAAWQGTLWSAFGAGLAALTGGLIVAVPVVILLMLALYLLLRRAEERD